MSCRHCAEPFPWVLALISVTVETFSVNLELALNMEQDLPARLPRTCHMLVFVLAVKDVMLLSWPLNFVCSLQARLSEIFEPQRRRNVLDDGARDVDGGV